MLTDRKQCCSRTLTQAFTACRFTACPLVPLTQAFTAYRLPKQPHFCGDLEWEMWQSEWEDRERNASEMRAEGGLQHVTLVTRVIPHASPHKWHGLHSPLLFIYPIIFKYSTSRLTSMTSLCACPLFFSTSVPGFLVEVLCVYRCSSCWAH